MLLYNNRVWRTASIYSTNFQLVLVFTRNTDLDLVLPVYTFWYVFNLLSNVATGVWQYTISFSLGTALPISSDVAKISIIRSNQVDRNWLWISHLNRRREYVTCGKHNCLWYLLECYLHVPIEGALTNFAFIV